MPEVSERKRDMKDIKDLFPHYDSSGIELVQRAYDFADDALRDVVRDDSHPFIEHPLGVALIASDEIGLPAECAAAVFLHEALRMNPSASVPQGAFPEEVMTLVEGLGKIATIRPKDTRLEAENYKKLIVQYSKDPRATVLKIADRLEVMRHLDLIPKSSREGKILETLMLYIPLAHQLGLYNIKSEMEDIYFRYAEPEQYRAIYNRLKATEKDREKLTRDFIRPLEDDLKAAGIDYKLKIRTKTAWSIYKKMNRQGVSFDGVYDVFAIRFIINCDGADLATERSLCWDVYSYVTKEYEPDTSRLRDWITQPKANGYESLHITVRNRDGAYVEVQIRTKRMDDAAENGAAAHWSYKGIKHEETMDKWLNSVRYTLEHKVDMKPEDLPAPPSREIFVFTPSGELRILPAGATMLDFAFNIHSGLGSRCTGGKVNGKAVSIKEKLSTGDVVEIMSSKNQKPTRDWLNWVVTSKARNKIKQMMGEEEYKSAAEGRELLERRLKNWKLTLTDEMLADINKKLHYTTVKSFYAAIGSGTVSVETVKNYILEHSAMHAEAVEAAKAAAASSAAESRDLWKAAGSSDDILVLNAKDLKGLYYKMAKCCHPVFGDDVFGFVTRTSGITIHRISCPNASRLIENYPYRIQKVRWADSPSSGSFQVTLRITCSQDNSVINRIMDIINNFKTSVRSFNILEDNRRGTSDIIMKISVPSNSELDKVMSQLRLLRQVIKVSRQ